jgi:hypothetical protein
LPLFHFRFDDGAGAADTEGLNHWVGKSAAVTVTDAAGAMLLRIELSGPPKG